MIRAKKYFKQDVWEYAHDDDVTELVFKFFCGEGRVTCQREVDARIGDFVAALAEEGFEPVERPRIQFVHLKYLISDSRFRRRVK